MADGCCHDKYVNDLCFLFSRKRLHWCLCFPAAFPSHQPQLLLRYSSITCLSVCVLPLLSILLTEAGFTSCI